MLAERGKTRHAQHAADKRAIEPHTKRRKRQQIYMPDEPRERHVHKRGRRAVHQDKIRDRTAGMAQQRPVILWFPASEVHAREKQSQKNHAQQPQKYHVVLRAPTELRDEFHAQPLADARDAKADEARSKADVVEVKTLMNPDSVPRDGRDEKADGHAASQHRGKAPRARQMHEPEAHKRRQTRSKQRLIDVFGKRLALKPRVEPAAEKHGQNV